MKPIFSARTRFNSALEILATFSPSSQISPEVGRSRQPIRLTSVDLPEPDGPMIAIHSPGARLSEKSSSARMVPPLASARAGYTRVTFLSWITLFALQDHSWLDPPQQRNWHHSGDQSHSYAARQNHRKYAEARHHRGIKVDSTDPCGDTYAGHKPSHGPDRAQGGSFASKERADQALGGP